MTKEQETPRSGWAKYRHQLWVLLKWIVFPLTTSMEIQEEWDKDKEGKKPAAKE